MNNKIIGVTVGTPYSRQKARAEVTDIVSGGLAPVLERISHNDKRITNLEKGLMADAFETDDTVAYIKDVPANALPYAAVAKVGGMTHKDGDTLKSAKVTEIESYVPYSGKHTLPIPEAVQALDGYGWGVSNEVYNYIDWEKKQFVKRVGCVDMGEQTWSPGAAASRFYCFVSNATPKGKAICLIYNVEYANDDKTAYITTLNGGEAIVVNDSAYSDAVAFKAAMSGVMFYYELAEPIVTDISDILTADNMIPVEGGGTITAVNENAFAVPTEIAYQMKGVAE